VSRQQLVRRCGLTEGEAEGLVARRALEAIFRASYTHPGNARTPETVAMAAVLRCGEHARLSGPFVLALFGIEGFVREDHFVVHVRSNRSVSNVPFEVVPDPSLGMHNAWIGPLPVFTPARALVEYARFARGKQLVSTIDRARWARVATTAQLASVVASLPADHPGAEVVRPLLTDGTLDHESNGERGLGALLEDVEGVEYNVWLLPDARVDAYLRDAMLALEFAGPVHDLPERRRRDAARDRRLQAQGIEVIYITAEDLDHPQALLVRTLGTRAARVAALRRAAASSGSGGS
jgi:hypothetical protein